MIQPPLNPPMVGFINIGGTRDESNAATFFSITHQLAKIFKSNIWPVHMVMSTACCTSVSGQDEL